MINNVPMININPVLPPGVFRLRTDPDKKDMHFLERTDDLFEIEGKNYGDVIEQRDIIWNRYAKALGSIGAMFTGKKGMGKSRIAELLANLAISMGIPVVLVTEINATISTVQYLASLKNVVIFFDEFGKNFNRPLQDKMLTMLSGIASGKKLFLITENNLNMLSDVILDRPGRILYHYHYDRVKEDVLMECLADHTLTKDVRNGIITKWREHIGFSMDHLDAIIAEHYYRPQDSFETILSRLNAGSLSKPKTLKVKTVTKTVTNKETGNSTTTDVEYVYDNDVTKDEFNTGRSMWLRINNDPTTHGIRIDSTTVVELEDDSITCRVGDITVVLI